jgi:hypothetical protein
MKAESEFIIESTNAKIGDDGWMRIAPWGDFPARGATKAASGQVSTAPVVQRITKETAQDVVNDFQTLVGKVQRFFRSVPIYMGHPDSIDGGSTYPDKGVKGAIAALEVRNDGLYAKPQFNEEGESLLSSTSGLAPSARFACLVEASNSGNVARPVRLRSVGLTKIPNLPVETINELRSTPIGADGDPKAAGEASAAKVNGPGAAPETANDLTDTLKAAVDLELGLAAGNKPTVPNPGKDDTGNATAGAAPLSQPRITPVDSPADQSGNVTPDAGIESASLKKSLENATQETANARAEAKAVREELITECINHALESGRISDADRTLWQSRLNANFIGERKSLAALPHKWNTASVIDSGRTKASGLGHNPVQAFTEVYNSKFDAHPEKQSNPMKAHQEAWAAARKENPDLYALTIQSPG